MVFNAEYPDHAYVLFAHLQFHQVPLLDAFLINSTTHVHTLVTVAEVAPNGGAFVPLAHAAVGIQIRFNCDLS